jgi:hypothetical protein
MTLNMLFEALHDGRVNMATTFPVSTKAWQMGGSRMFVEPADRPTVEELIHGIIINSGNDACVVVAEGLAGTEEAFARSMNERAKQLGMTQSHFANASGWPDPEQRMSMRDLGILAEHLVKDFPDLYKNFALTSYNYKNRVPSNANNRNPLLKLHGGDWKADGLKTGHTQEAGYGLVGSAVQGDRRIIFVITGLPSDKARAEEAERIANWAYRQFTMRTLLPKGEIVAQAPVWLGERSRVGRRYVDRDDLGELDERCRAVNLAVGVAVVVHGQHETLGDELAAAFYHFVRRCEPGFELEHDERRRQRFDHLAQQEVAIDLDEGAIGTERLLARWRGKGLRERVVDVFAGTFAGDHAVLQHERKCEQLLLAAKDRLAADIKQRVRWIRCVSHSVSANRVPGGC